MPNFLVRLIGTRDLVGFFTASDLETLREIVDECTDVPACEYREIMDGGIYWESPAVPVPMPEVTVESVERAPLFPWHGAAVSDGWLSEIYDDIQPWHSLLEAANDQE